MTVQWPLRAVIFTSGVEFYFAVATVSPSAVGAEISLPHLEETLRFDFIVGAVLRQCFTIGTPLSFVFPCEQDRFEVLAGG